MLGRCLTAACCCCCLAVFWLLLGCCPSTDAGCCGCEVGGWVAVAAAASAAADAVYSVCVCPAKQYTAGQWHVAE